MADFPRSFPNEYVENFVTISSTGYDVGFGFNASLIRIKSNVGGTPKQCYVSLRSTTGGSTATGNIIATGDDVQFFDLGVGCAGLAFSATSSGAVVYIGAWG